MPPMPVACDREARLAAKSSLQASTLLRLTRCKRMLLYAFARLPNIEQTDCSSFHGLFCGIAQCRGHTWPTTIITCGYTCRLLRQQRIGRIPSAIGLMLFLCQAR